MPDPSTIEKRLRAIGEGELNDEAADAIRQLLAERDKLRTSIETVCKTLEKDIEQGYQSRTRTYVLDIFKPIRAAISKDQTND